MAWNWSASRLPIRAGTCRTSSTASVPARKPIVLWKWASACRWRAGWRLRAIASSAPCAGTRPKKRSCSTGFSLFPNHMDFEYTSEQLQLRRAVREFAQAEILPHVMEWDEAQTFPLEVIKKLGQL